MAIERRVVDNRMFLLQLDSHYRSAMKQQERGELLRCARETARSLAVAPADVPIEGYYYEEEALTEYFRLLRALQQTAAERAAELSDSAELARLVEVCSSPIFGEPGPPGQLLPMGIDPMTQALARTRPDWTVARLCATAHEAVASSSDYSLVGLAALARDEVVLASLRESVVLYESIVEIEDRGAESPPEYVWAVDPEIEQRAVRFVETANVLLGASIPLPGAGRAALYWDADALMRIDGRCVRLGDDPHSDPPRYYHWAVDLDSVTGATVRDFWAEDLWTTERYRAEGAPPSHR